MSYRHTLDAALESLNETAELIQRFPENGKIPSIEIDLALQKLRSLYELLLLMRGNEVYVDTSQEAVSEPVVNKPEDTGILVEESKKTTVTVTSSVEEVMTVREEEKPAPTVEKKSVISKKSKQDVQTLADQFKGRPTLLESLNKTYNSEDEGLSRTKPVTDLLSAIALNDRFTFVRELFNNDKKAFESTIAVLNEADNFDIAYNYMEQQLNWDMEDEAVQMLLSVVRRKFIKIKHE